MKTFSDRQILVGISCLLALLSTNGIHADASVSETAQRPNLRRSLQPTQSQDAMQQQQHIAVRSLDEESGNETDELESIEKEFSGETAETESSENETESETEKLEQIEEEFDGGDDNNNKEEKSEVAKEEEEATAAEEETPDTEEEVVEEEAETETETKTTDVPTVAPVPAPVVAPTEKPVVAPTAKPTPKPYEKDDGYDPIQAEDEKHAEEEEVQELQTELKQEEKVARRAGGLGIFFGILAMIFTAHQMSENPDGIYASVCRLAITISSVVVKIVCMPCRKVLGIGGNGNPYSGHMPISTSDYSYRNDPYRSNANAGFEMS